MNSQAGRYSLKSFAEGSFRIAVAPGRAAQTEEHTHRTSSVALSSKGGQDRVWEPSVQRGS